MSAATLNPMDRLGVIEERASGDSRKWKSSTVEPNAAILSVLEFCNLRQYLDLIMKYTKNSKEVFINLDKTDLNDIGITNEEHCQQIEEAIQLIGGKRAKITPVTLSEGEAIQILKNVHENLKNINLGMHLYMDELIENKPENFFVSEFDGRTAAHDALDFIRTTKHVYRNLVEYLHEKECLSDNDYNTIISNLNKSPMSKSKKKKLKWFAMTITVGSIFAIGWLLIPKLVK